MGFQTEYSPDAVYKATKPNGSTIVKTNGSATVEDEEDAYNLAAGPEIPLEEEEPPNDEDGRFFGGGVTKNTADVLDFIDEREQGDEVCLLNSTEASTILFPPPFSPPEAGENRCGMATKIGIEFRKKNQQEYRIES